MHGVTAIIMTDAPCITGLVIPSSHRKDLGHATAALGDELP
jgi:hypothetical protein